MKGIDRLREYVKDAPASSMGEMARAIVAGMADEIEREAADMVPLPVDADGEAIHVGDVMDGYQLTIEVGGLSWDGESWSLVDACGTRWHDCAAFSHHHATTVEDVLADVADRAANLTGSYHEGCMNGDEYMDSMRALVAEYAEKLRLAGDE